MFIKTRLWVCELYNSAIDPDNPLILILLILTGGELCVSHGCDDKLSWGCPQPVHHAPQIRVGCETQGRLQVRQRLPCVAADPQ